MIGSVSKHQRRRGLPAVLAAAALLAAAPPAAALSRFEVLVVANANAKRSTELARFYCLARGIPKDRIVVIRTTAGAIVGRAEYNTRIRDPIRQFLTRSKLKDRTKCIALMWGVPVRVMGTELTTRQRKLTSAYRAAAKRLHGRMAVNMELLRTIAVKFPKPRTESLDPIGKLFEPLAAARLGKPDEFAKLAKAFRAALPRKTAEAAAVKAPPRRHIALRQLAAVRLDSLGAADLLGNLPAESVSAVPGRDDLRKRREALRAELAKLRPDEQTPATLAGTVELVRKLRGVIGAHGYCRKQMQKLDTEGEDASVDSELAVIWEKDHALTGPLPNPLRWRRAQITSRPVTGKVPRTVVMTARIDGPSVTDALRIVEDSVAVEKTGIKGTFYIDAGGKYAHYDKHLFNLAALVGKHTKIRVVLDKKKALFPPRSCPDAALYVGWYSLRKYVPAFTWVRGAVAWHIASFEAHDIRTPASPQWCAKMIQNGVAATCGAVNEPYLSAFPPPEEFFALLLTGHFTVAECYWRTTPAVSWRMTLIADPLYNPFKLHPRLSIHALPAKLAGAEKLRELEGK